eukprot:snap_masked-scaffold_52-processed-gene-1.78-mRNA-1 protein AED:0.15 eAED:0.15 QI:0/-1/0/1/-1/1/1/0/250
MTQRNEEIQPSVEIEYGAPLKKDKIDKYDISTESSINHKSNNSFKTVLLLLVSIVILFAVMLVLEFILDDDASTPTFAPTDPNSTNFPTFSTTSSPSIYPTLQPTNATSFPTSYPTFSPTNSTGDNSTAFPTSYPTFSPTNSTAFPTSYPTFSHTPSPTSIPTISPTDSPTISPTPAPTSLAEYLCKDVEFGGNSLVSSCLSSTSLIVCQSNGNGAILTCGNCACPVDVFVVPNDIFDLCATTSCEEVPQ